MRRAGGCRLEAGGNAAIWARPVYDSDTRGSTAILRWATLSHPSHQPPAYSLQPETTAGKGRGPHEIHATLKDVCRTATRLLRKKGRICLIYPAVRLADLVCRLRAFDLEPKTLRMIHSKSGDGAGLVLVFAVKGGNPGMTVAPPLFIYEDNGAYTPEMLQMFSARGAAPEQGLEKGGRL